MDNAQMLTLIPEWQHSQDGQLSTFQPSSLYSLGPNTCVPNMGATATCGVLFNVDTRMFELNFIQFYFYCIVLPYTKVA